MKLRRATPPTDPGAYETEELDDQPALLDNPFRIQADEHRAEQAEPPATAAPAELVDDAPATDQAETEGTIDLRAEAPVPADAAHLAPPPTPAPEATPAPSATRPATEAGDGLMDTSITEADRRDALDLTTVRPQAKGRPTRASRAEPARGFLSAEPPRLGVESALVRLIATVGVIAIGTAVGAALVANQVEGWIVGLSVSLVCVILAAILWRSRRL